MWIWIGAAITALGWALLFFWVGVETGSYLERSVVVNTHRLAIAQMTIFGGYTILIAGTLMHVLNIISAYLSSHAEMREGFPREIAMRQGVTPEEWRQRQERLAAEELSKNKDAKAEPRKDTTPTIKG